MTFQVCLSSYSTLKKSKLITRVDILLVWFMQERTHRMPAHGPVVTEKALALHQKIGSTKSFTVIDG